MNEFTFAVMLMAAASGSDEDILYNSYPIKLAPTHIACQAMKTTYVTEDHLWCESVTVESVIAEEFVDAYRHQE